MRSAMGNAALSGGDDRPAAHAASSERTEDSRAHRWAAEVFQLLRERADLDALEEASDDELELTKRLVLGVLPQRSGERQWDRQIGPFYSWRAVAVLLGGVTRPTVDNRRKDREILGVKTSDDRWLYPTFQWLVRDGSWTALPHLRRVLEVLVPERHDSGLHAAWWLRTPNRLLAGRAPARWMAEGGDVQRLLTAARAEADALDPALPA